MLYASFGAWIKSCYGQPVVRAQGGINVTLHVPEGATVDRVAVMEDQTKGERITSWRILVNGVDTVLAGTSVGHKIIQLLPNATALKGPSTLTFEVLGSLAQPSVRSFAAFDGANC